MLAFALLHFQHPCKPGLGEDLLGLGEQAIEVGAPQAQPY
jgi:hypothetical protein